MRSPGGIWCIAALAGGVWFDDPAAASVPVSPSVHTVAPGQTVTFTVPSSDVTPSGYQWRANGVAIPHATSAALTLTDVQPVNAGLYAAGAAISDLAILALQSTAKVIGDGEEIQRDVYVAANGNTFDQVLLQGPAAAITADHTSGQITRVSFVDLSDDIVQVEFSGPGTLSLVLDNYSSPAPPAHYDQAVNYVKGHAGIVIAGATEDTNVSVFSVGRITAVNQSLFKAGVTYDGFADIAFIAISSANGKFGGVRTANASYFATQGLAGLYAPGVQFTGPIYLGDVQAWDFATPAILIGSSSNETRIAGGDLFQPNARPVAIDGLTRLKFTAGQDSHGNVLLAKTNRAVLQQNDGGTPVEVSDHDGTEPPAVSISATPGAADESGLQRTHFTIARTGGFLSALTVHYEVNGSATAGSDYMALSGSAVLPAGVESVEIPILPQADGITEGAENVRITLRPSESYLLKSDSSATVWIVDGLHAFLETIRSRHGIPGLAAVVFDSERVLAIGAAGTRKVGSGVPLLHTDKIQIASISKTMTATVVAKLVEAGKLSWDATLAQLYPEFAASMDARYRSVTIDMMLRHLGGMPQWMRNDSIVTHWTQDHRHLDNRGKRYEAVKYIVTHPPAHAPGSRHYYTNDSYLVLGNVCERATGIAWETLLSQTLFEPLGMTSSGFGDPSNDRTLNGVWGHVKNGGRFEPWDPAPEYFSAVPFGSAYGSILHSSVGDLAKHGIFHLRGDLGLDATLTPATFRRLHHAPLTAIQSFPERFAAGFFNEGELHSDGRWVNVQHWGYYARGRTLFWFSPQANVGAAILTNGTDEDPVLGMAPISEAVIELFRRYRSTSP